MSRPGHAPTLLSFRTTTQPALSAAVQLCKSFWFITSGASTLGVTGVGAPRVGRDVAARRTSSTPGAEIVGPEFATGMSAQSTTSPAASARFARGARPVAWRHHDQERWRGYASDDRSGSGHEPAATVGAWRLGYCSGIAPIDHPVARDVPTDFGLACARLEAARGDPPRGQGGGPAGDGAVRRPPLDAPPLWLVLICLISSALALLVALGVI